MADSFEAFQPGLDSPAEHHYEVVIDGESPSTATVLDPTPRYLYVATNGNVEIIDADGVSVTYAVTAGQVLRFRPYSLGLATTATIIAWY
jgi:hypothetical protein